MGLNGIAKDSNEVAKNQVAFLKSAIGFSGENVQAIKDALKEEKETGKLNSKQVELLKNRIKALKAIFEYLIVFFELRDWTSSFPKSFPSHDLVSLNFLKIVPKH